MPPLGSLVLGVAIRSSVIRAIGHIHVDIRNTPCTMGSTSRGLINPALSNGENPMLFVSEQAVSLPACTFAQAPIRRGGEQGRRGNPFPVSTSWRACGLFVRARRIAGVAEPPHSLTPRTGKVAAMLRIESKDGSTTRRIAKRNSRPRLTVWPQNESEWPPKAAERDDGQDEQEFIYEPAQPPLTVHSSRGFMLGRFAADQLKRALECLDRWPAAAVLVQGATIVARKSGETVSLGRAA